MPAPAITAIIPYYRGSRFIRQAVESVVAQTLPPCELIVVDDGDPDGGPAPYIDGVAAPFPIRIERKENGGQSSARNLGARLASGDYLAWLDQDDEWYPDHLERLVAPLLRDNTVGFTYGNADEMDVNGGVVRYRMFDDLNPPHPKRRLQDLLRHDMFIIPTCTMARKAAVEACGGFDERLSGYEDDDLYLRMWRRYRSAYVSRPVSRWRTWPESSSYIPRVNQSRRIYAQKLIDAFPNDPQTGIYWVRDCIAPRFFDNCLGVYLRSIRVGRWDQAVEMHNDMLRWSLLYDVGRKMRFRLYVMANPRRYAEISALYRKLPARVRAIV
jgi:glycosyltransferase involved in cell wall biosynthesis